MMKEVREEIALMEKAGWNLEGFDSRRGHIHMTYRGDRHIWLPCSPSDHMWKQPSRQEAARRMGVTRPELEIRMGIRDRKAKRGARRTRRRSRQAELTRRLNPPPATKPANDEFVTAEQLGITGKEST